MRAPLLLVLLFVSAAHAEEARPRLTSDAPLLSTPSRQERWLVPTLHTVGVIGVMRGSLSVLWPEHFDPLRFEQMGAQFNASWSGPPDFRSERSLIESDGDPWILNTVGHGLFGSEVYLRFRQCGHRPFAAAASTTVASTAWEYGVEAFHKRPSGIDLVWTPLIGSLFGEARYQLYQLLRGDPSREEGRSALLFLVDPFGEAERRVLGTDC